MTMQEFLDDVHRRLTPSEHDDMLRLVSEASQKIADLHSHVADADKLNDLHPFQAGAITDEWIDANLQRQADRERGTAATNLLKSFIAEAEGRAQEATPNKAAVLSEYHDRLTELLAEAAAIVKQLNGAHTPEEAIAADRAAEWKQLTQLAGDYRTLRRAQMHRMPTDLILAAAPSLRGEDHASDCFLANLDQLWPTWRQPMLTNRTVYLDPSRPDDRREPWPADPIQLLIWLVNSKAQPQPWIPSPAQLRKLWSDRRDRVNGAAKPVGVRPERETYNSPASQFGGPGSMAESFIAGRLAPRITATESNER